MSRTALHTSALLTLLASLALLPATAAAEPYYGYTLFSPNNSTHTYLCDMNNSIVFSWTHNREGGYSCYLLGDGTLMRPALGGSSNLNGGGAAGITQRVTPGGALLWEFTYSNNSHRTHHDICPMPNGHVLLIAWERKTAAEAEQAGLDHYAEIWPDHIIEVEQAGATGGNIVWEWHAWDHLIQDHDPSKDNYGVISEHPELLDINMGSSPLGGDWMHTNGIDYNPEWDQIIISSHELDEVYVIDHSTSTEEAASHAGGNSGMGGDILYRWGRPANYDRPGPQVFNVVHCSIWIPSDCPGAGHIMAFNNREGTGSSEVIEIIPPADAEGHYTIEPGAAYGPDSPTWTYSASGFYSNHLGGCQRLPNGNTVIVESTSGYLFEVNAGGNLEWSYARGGEIARCQRYGIAYPGLGALGLVDAPHPGADASTRPLRLSECSPNPFSDHAVISYDVPARSHVTLKLYDILGRELTTLRRGTEEAGRQSVSLDGSSYPNGVYFYRLAVGEAGETGRLVVQR